MLVLRATRRRRQVGPVEPGLAVHVRRDVALRARTGGRRPAYTGMSVRPASSSTRRALAVVLSSVWLPETVVTPTSSTSGEASASRSAIASSWPGSQSRMMGVGVMRRVLPASSAAVGREGCAPRREAASAPAAHARASASPRSRPSSSETTRQRGERVTGCGAVHSLDARGGRARDLDAVLEERGSLGAVGDGDELSPRDDLVLEPVHDQQVGLELDRTGGRRVERQRRTRSGRRRARRRPAPRAGRGRLRQVRSAAPARWRRARRRSGSRRRRRRGSAAMPVVPARRTSSSTPASTSPASASSASASSPTAPTIRTRAPSRAAATAWFAPLPPAKRSNARPATVSPARGSRATRATRSRLIEPTTVSSGATARAYARPKEPCRTCQANKTVSDTGRAVSSHGRLRRGSR